MFGIRHPGVKQGKTPTKRFVEARRSSLVVGYSGKKPPVAWMTWRRIEFARHVPKRLQLPDRFRQ